MKQLHYGEPDRAGEAHENDDPDQEPPARAQAVLRDKNFVGIHLRESILRSPVFSNPARRREHVLRLACPSRSSHERFRGSLPGRFRKRYMLAHTRPKRSRGRHSFQGTPTPALRTKLDWRGERSGNGWAPPVMDGPPVRVTLLFAGFADHLETFDAQVAGFFRFCFLAFFCLRRSLFGFLRFRFVMTHADYGHRMTNVLGKLDLRATQFPGLAILTGDCKLIRGVALLQATGHGHVMVHRLGSRRLCGRRGLLRLQCERGEANQQGCSQPNGVFHVDMSHVDFLLSLFCDLLLLAYPDCSGDGSGCSCSVRSVTSSHGASNDLESATSTPE